MLVSGGACDRLKFDLETVPAELPDALAGPGLDRTLFEVVGAKVLMGSTILQHVIDRGEQRGGYGADCHLRPAFSAQPVERCPVVAVLLPFGGPCALDEHGLEPWSAFSQM